ncbi:MAG TPA: glycoside hydrolase family 25 protein [Candidatus Fimivivens faecavium]|nr:glycoside hydrolase family 25 protein [Candidatus Fimivivens faecavium]
MTKIPGIDVSEHQGGIDWQLVKTDADFAFIRVGYTWYAGGLEVDSRFSDNMNGALAAGVPAGVYAYAYDRTPDAAQKSARAVLRRIQGYRVEYPVVYDFEDVQYLKNTPQQNAAIAGAFLKEIQAAGYFAMLYASTSYLTEKLDLSALGQYAVWVADYRDPSGTECPYQGPFAVWQYRGGAGDGGGRCAGVEGYCDRDLDYVGLARVIRDAGLNHLDEGEVPPPGSGKPGPGETPNPEEKPETGGGTPEPPDGGEDGQPEKKPCILMRVFRAVCRFFAAAAGRIANAYNDKNGPAAG